MYNRHLQSLNETNKQKKTSAFWYDTRTKSLKCLWKATNIQKEVDVRRIRPGAVLCLIPEGCTKFASRLEEVSPCGYKFSLQSCVLTANYFYVWRNYTSSGRIFFLSIHGWIPKHLRKEHMKMTYNPNPGILYYLFMLMSIGEASYP